MTAELADSQSMADHALAYWADAWSVFPVCSPVPSHRGYCEQHGACKNPGKLPLIKWGMYQDRTPTKLEVQTWWRRWPSANIGLATGVTSDIVVVDLDGELAQTAADRYGYNPGPWARTGRVGGRHLYFRYRDDAPTIFAKAGGIDFRGQGGFVLLPPSLHYTGNRYSWGQPVERGDPLPDLPRWIDDLATTNSSGERGPIDFGKLLAEGVDQGQRDQELFRAAAKLRGADVPYELAVQLIQGAAAQCKPPFDQDEARAKVDSAYSRYQPNPAPPMQLFGQGTAAVDPTTGEVLEESPWRTLGDLVRTAPDSNTQLVQGFLWAARTHWCFSGPGAGKTLFWLAVLMHMAAGKDMPLDSGDNPPMLAITQGAVLLIEEDSPDSIISDYVQMLADIYDINLDEIPFYVNRLRGIKITDEAGLQQVRNMIAAAPTKPAVLALDACERIVPSDKFSSKELDPLSRLFAKNLADGITNLTIDHTRKPTGTTEKPDPIDTLYGGRAKSAISDVMIHFSGGIRDTALVTFPKFRGDAPLPVSIKFDGSVGFTIKPGVPKLTDSERAVMLVLNNAFGRRLTSEDIASSARLGLRSVQRAVTKLVEMGWVDRAGSAKTTVYGALTGAPGIFGE